MSETRAPASYPGDARVLGYVDVEERIADEEWRRFRWEAHAPAGGLRGELVDMGYAATAERAEFLGREALRFHDERLTITVTEDPDDRYDPARC